MDGVQAMESVEARRRPLIPAHIFWPGLVVSILGLSVLANVALVLSATSDNGAQVEEDYYQQAVDWDAHRELLRESAALGWGAAVELGAPGTGQRVTLRDRAGQPLDGATGRLLARHATQAQGLEGALTPVPGSPGVYTSRIALDRPGLWDLTVDVEREGQRFLQVTRQEAATP